MLPSFVRGAKSIEDFFCWDPSFTWIRKPAPNLCGLLLGQTQLAPILLFHNFNHMRYVGLTRGWPRQNAIEDCLYLFSCHGGMIPNRR
jgi:hypothetical protein